MLRARHELDTLLTADSVEWCRHSEHRDLLACATYQLDQDTRERKGNVQIYRLNKRSLSLSECYIPDEVCCGVLDMKWASPVVAMCSESPQLTLACSDGCIRLLNLNSKDCNPNTSPQKYSMNVIKSSHCSDGLCLSVDWSQSGERMVTSCSDGQVVLLSVTATSLQPVHSWKAHGYEAWVAAISQDEQTVYSGGDDCRLCVWDLRTPCQEACITCKKHDMGVCCVQQHPSLPHLIASGGYDEVARLWDVRMMGEPIKQLPLGGGVWRVKWSPLASNMTMLMAAACMHSGFKIVNWNGEEEKPVIVASYTRHRSLAYGIDWCYEDLGEVCCKRQENGGVNEKYTNEFEFVLASCSFYDHSLHLWTCSINKQ